MANWHYCNKNGEKVGPITPTALKLLTQQGVISRETVLENHNGRTAVAGDANGLTFPAQLDTAPKLTVTPTGSDEVYGLAIPETRITPLTETMPQTVSPPKTDEPVNAVPPVVERSIVNNPFVKVNPFAISVPTTVNPSAVAPEAVNPFTVPAPNTNQTPPHRVSGKRFILPIIIVLLLGIVVAVPLFFLRSFKGEERPQGERNVPTSCVISVSHYIIFTIPTLILYLLFIRSIKTENLFIVGEC